MFWFDFKFHFSCVVRAWWHLTLPLSVGLKCLNLVRKICALFFLVLCGYCVFQASRFSLECWRMLLYKYHHWRSPTFVFTWKSWSEGDSSWRRRSFSPLPPACFREYLLNFPQCLEFKKLVPKIRIRNQLLHKICRWHDEWNNHWLEPSESFHNRSRRSAKGTTAKRSLNMAASNIFYFKI